MARPGPTSSWWAASGPGWPPAGALRGHGRVVGIVGEPGIGKSQLIAGFRQGLAGQPVTYREATCHSYASAIPYGPILDVLRQSCGLAEDDGAETTAARVRALLEVTGLDPDERAPYLLHLLGLATGTETLTPEPFASAPRTRSGR